MELRFVLEMTVQFVGKISLGLIPWMGSAINRPHVPFQSSLYGLK
jgi:hypothetical protein